MKKTNTYEQYKFETQAYTALTGKKTKWLNFTVSFRFPVGISMVILYIIGSLLSSSVLLLLQFIELIFLIYSYGHIKELSKTGYYCYIVKCVCETILLSASSTINTITPDMQSTPLNSDIILYGLLFFLIQLLLLSIIYLLPNIIYIRKRKDLFFNTWKVDNTETAAPEPDENSRTIQGYIYDPETGTADKKNFIKEKLPATYGKHIENGVLYFIVNRADGKKRFNFITAEKYNSYTGSKYCNVSKDDSRG